MKISYLLSFIIFAAFLSNTHAIKYDFVVAQDGSGDFFSIQAALNSVPLNHTKRFIIYIKNGIYNEKLFIETDNIALVGESPKETRIVFSELRKNWRINHQNDYGSAVINIKNKVEDVLFSSLMIYNNYGSLFGDHDHAFSIRAGEGVTRIIIDNCNIISDGGDTVGLWNNDNGMYYHSNSHFEGWVDYVCPRGYCYIENCTFFGHNLTASIWHDGSQNENHKFVLHNCKFDGVKEFPLGRFHRDAQFYLIDCSFSANMANQKISFAPSNPPRILEWGENRIYFYNCHGDSVDYSWHRDNLEFAPGHPSSGIINAGWTFNYKWDPVSELDSFYKTLKSEG